MKKPKIEDFISFGAGATAEYDHACYRYLEWQNTKMRDALYRIGAFNDTSASERLLSKGSYALFDEPGSVKLARICLDEIKASES